MPMARPAEETAAMVPLFVTPPEMTPLEKMLPVGFKMGLEFLSWTARPMALAPPLTLIMPVLVTPPVTVVPLKKTPVPRLPAPVAQRADRAGVGEATGDTAKNGHDTLVKFLSALLPALIVPELKIPPETVVSLRMKAPPVLLLIVPVFTMRPVIVVKLLTLLPLIETPLLPPLIVPLLVMSPVTRVVVRISNPSLTMHHRSR